TRCADRPAGSARTLRCHGAAWPPENHEAPKNLAAKRNSRRIYSPSMTWFKREKKPMEPVDERHVVTEGLWIKCTGCKDPLWKKDLEGNLQVCPKCSYHYKITAYVGINLLMDAGWLAHDVSLYSTDPLDSNGIKPYKESIAFLPDNVRAREAL